MFSTHAYDIGRCKNPDTGKEFSYRVRGEASPYISKFIPVNDLKRNNATEIVNKLTEHGIIKHMCSPWASASVCVSKACRALTKEEAVDKASHIYPFRLTNLPV